MPDPDIDRRGDARDGHADTVPHALAQLSGLLLALWNGEVILANAAWHQVRRAVILGTPSLLVSAALVLVAIGQTGFVLAVGLHAAGLGALWAHICASIAAMVLALLVLWLVYRLFSRARDGVKRVAQSLQADLNLISHDKVQKPQGRKEQDVTDP